MLICNSLNRGGAGLFNNGVSFEIPNLDIASFFGFNF